MGEALGMSWIGSEALGTGNSTLVFDAGRQPVSPPEVIPSLSLLFKVLKMF